MFTSTHSGELNLLYPIMGIHILHTDLYIIFLWC